ncbi:MAG: hypothetical protein LBB07_02945 [Bifidobacteriaceae bacterium]|jgi:hypothetical protein|nr:hypothetical protein [Bifidobacteriaceae bacterium]
MRKLIFFAISLLFLCIVGLSSCSAPAPSDLSLNQNPIVAKVVPMQIASGAIPEAAVLSKVIENGEKYKFSRVQDSELLHQQIQDGTYNFTIMKTLDAAKLYKSSEKRIKIIATISKNLDWSIVANLNYLHLNMNNAAEFMQDISASIDWIYSNQKDAISMTAKDKLTSKSELQPLIKKKIFKYLDGPKMKTELNKFFKKNKDLAPIPKSDIYFIRT